MVEPFISSLPFGSKHDSAETGQGSKYGEADCSITGHHGEAQSALGCEVGMELMQHAQRNNSVYVVIHHYPIDILCTHTHTHTHTHTYIYIYIGVVCRCTPAHTCMHACTHTHTHIYIYLTYGICPHQYARPTWGCIHVHPRNRK